MRPDARTAFLLAFLKSREAGLVTRGHADRLASARENNDLLKVLRDTEIGVALAGASDRGAHDRDRLLWSHLADTVEGLLARPFFPSDAAIFGRAYLLKYDVANLKTAISALALDDKPVFRPIGILHSRDLLGPLAACESVQDVSEILGRAGLESFRSAIAGLKPSAGPQAPFAAEASLDSEYYRLLTDASRRLSEGDITAMACGLMIDLANLALVFRALIIGMGAAVSGRLISGGYLLGPQTLHDCLSQPLQDVPRRMEHAAYREIAAEIVDAWKESEAISTPDAIIEKHRLAALRGILSPRLAPGPAMAWFLIVKEIEIRNVRLLLQAVDDGIAFEDIRPLLLF